MTGEHDDGASGRAVWEPWDPDGRKFEAIIVERKDAIVRVTLDNPTKLNSVTRRMFAEVTGIGPLLREHPDVGVLILTGAGRGFSSGMDMKEWVDHRLGGAARAEIPEHAGREWPLMSDFPVPVIAAVNGPAAGAGFVMSLMADFRIASSNAFFVESHVERNLTPSIAAWYLPRIVGQGRANELVLLGRRIGAQQALDWGLVNQVTEPEDLLDAAETLARELLALPRFAVVTARGAMARTWDRDVHGVREWAGDMEAIAHALGLEGGSASGRH